MKPIPEHANSSKEIDEYFQPYFHNVKVAGKAAAALMEFLEAELEDAKTRATDLKNMPSQAKAFFKLQQGMSDALKDKCVPRNQATLHAIQESIKMLRKEQGEIAKCLAQAVKVDNQGAAGPKMYELRAFCVLYITAIEPYAKIETLCRSHYKAYLKQEETAIKLLKDYLSDKESLKNAPSSEIAKLKQTYQHLMEELK